LEERGESPPDPAEQEESWDDERRTVVEVEVVVELLSPPA
jgi:hypothetical protein